MIVSPLGSYMRAYARRNYKRIGRAALGMAVRRYKRTYTTRTRYLRGTARKSGMRRKALTTKRKWSSAMGTTNQPSARTKLRRSRYHNKLGLKIGAHPTRKYRKITLEQELVDKELKALPMVQVEAGFDDSTMNNRSGRLVDVKGVKLRMWFRLKNQAEGSIKLDFPIHIRWAIINPENQPTGTQLDVSTGTNFFINDNPADDDAKDFEAEGTCFRYMNRRINRRRYGVLQEGTIVLQNDVGSTNSRMDKRGLHFLSQWIPINKQMKWPNTTPGETNRFPRTNIYFVYWYCQMGDTTNAKKFPSAQNDTPFDVLHEEITYFNNPQKIN